MFHGHPKNLARLPHEVFSPNFRMIKHVPWIERLAVPVLQIFIDSKISFKTLVHNRFLKFPLYKYSIDQRIQLYFNSKTNFSIL